jgi:heparanase
LVIAVGNELCGEGVSAKVNATLYAEDLIKLKKIIHRIYRGFDAKDRPKLLTPGGFFNLQWFAEMLQATGPNVVDVVTHHVYNLGPGTLSEFMFSKFSFTIVLQK